ncbi:hypothetical protein GCM10007049_23310 [Echinicola pacifica]|uniref:ABC transporter domain-containing protein n=1 Tax=Echinicola pacifica TaxID=346377 RepID=A0A918Q080_9BACT|nr:ABC transporter ATP-binding protein [Echinicola pacifica]GGZ29423.1 hypothetical protein GCM10007049_23310 [Echinicola pacifica]
MFSLNEISLRINTKDILSPITLNLPQGSVCAVLGKNGSGKSSLLNIISTLQKPSKGSLSYQGQPLDKSNIKQYLAALSYTPQKVGLMRDLSVEDNIIYFSVLKGCNHSDSLQQMSYFLHEFNLTAIAKEKAGNLSGGQYQMIGLIIALIPNPGLLVLDEPFNNLGYTERQLFLHYIQEHLKTSIVILSTHILDEIFQKSTHILCLNGGKKTYFGDQKGFLRQTTEEPSLSCFLEAYHYYAHL